MNMEIGHPKLTFTEVRHLDPGMIGMCCGNCRRIKEKRRDSVALGLHSFVCVHCGMTSTLVVTLDGKVKMQLPEDHKS